MHVPPDGAIVPKKGTKLKDGVRVPHSDLIPTCYAVQLVAPPAKHRNKFKQKTQHRIEKALFPVEHYLDKRCDSKIRLGAAYYVFLRLRLHYLRTHIEKLCPTPPIVTTLIVDCYTIDQGSDLKRRKIDFAFDETETDGEENVREMHIKRVLQQWPNKGFVLEGEDENPDQWKDLFVALCEQMTVVRNRQKVLYELPIKDVLSVVEFCGKVFGPDGQSQLRGLLIAMQNPCRKSFCRVLHNDTLLVGGVLNHPDGHTDDLPHPLSNEQGVPVIPNSNETPEVSPNANEVIANSRATPNSSPNAILNSGDLPHPFSNANDLPETPVRPLNENQITANSLGTQNSLLNSDGPIPTSGSTPQLLHNADATPPHSNESSTILSPGANPPEQGLQSADLSVVPSDVRVLFSKIRQDLELNSPPDRITEVLRLERRVRVLQFYLKAKNLLKCYGAKDNRPCGYNITEDEARLVEELRAYISAPVPINCPSGRNDGRNDIEKFHVRLVHDLSPRWTPITPLVIGDFIKGLMRISVMLCLVEVFGPGIYALLHQNILSRWIKDFPKSCLEQAMTRIHTHLPNTKQICNHIETNVILPLFEGRDASFEPELLDGSKSFLSLLTGNDGATNIQIGDIIHQEQPKDVGGGAPDTTSRDPIHSLSTMELAQELLYNIEDDDDYYTFI